jgi:hypothetical protein
LIWNFDAAGIPNNRQVFAEHGNASLKAIAALSPSEIEALILQLYPAK